jgi:hypothetical protein
MSVRAKQIRQAQQVIELLNVWSATSGMNRNRVRDSLKAKYGAGTWDFSFSSLSEVNLHKMRADLIAQLEPLLLPAAPTNPTPSIGATDVSASPTLSWNAAPGTTFDVYLDFVNPPVAKVASGISSPSFSSGPLLGGTIFYWQVVVHNSDGPTMGPVWSFTTELVPPAAPGNPTPGDGAVAVASPTTLSWNGAGPGVTFDVYFDTTNPPAAKVASGQSAGTYSPSGLTAATRYYWKVVAINVIGQTPGSVWTFATRIVGDGNQDGYVNVGDLQLLIAAWGSNNGGGWGNWNPNVDFTSDGAIDINDLVLLVSNWARTVP